MKISGVDLNLFEFDYDLTWAAFFLNSEGKVYGRYGSRDASGADSRNTLAGLRHALEAAAAAHKRGAGAKPDRVAKPLLAEEYPAAKRRKNNECIHCHQVNEFRRDQQQAKGQWNRDERWMYPLPENVGLTLDLDKGNHVKTVVKGSPAERAGLKPGDVLSSINGVSVASVADVQYGLHRAPAKGKVEVAFSRVGKEAKVSLDLADGWRKTNTTWRPSLLDVLPSLSIFGDDLSAKEKKALGLAEKRLAFRQDEPLYDDAKRAGMKVGDAIVGVDGLEMEMTATEFLGHVRRNYLRGDRITLNVLRDGKRLDLPLTLK